MIKNLLFDLGGVIIDIERERCVRAFEALGLEQADSYFGDYAQTGVFMQIEDGSINEDQFHNYLRHRLPSGTTNAQIDEAFQRFIVGIPIHRLQALRRLREQGYKIYLISNTNPIMWNGIIDSEFRKEGLTREDYFDGMITSFEAKSAKPDTEIFLKLHQKYHIRPAETLFFDDSRANTEAGRSLGLHVALVKPGTEFTDYLPAE